MPVINHKDFARKFKPVFNEMELIESEIHQTSGFLWFTYHVCTKEELLKSEHFSKIDSITRKIGDDIENWDKNNQLSKKEAKQYHEKRDNVEDRLHAIKLEIKKREDTWWEQFTGAFSSYAELIMDNLPDVVVQSVLGVIFGRFLPGKNRDEPQLKPWNR